MDNLPWRTRSRYKLLTSDPLVQRWVDVTNAMHAEIGEGKEINLSPNIGRLLAEAKDVGEQLLSKYPHFKSSGQS